MRADVSFLLFGVTLLLLGCAVPQPGVPKSGMGGASGYSGYLPLGPQARMRAIVSSNVAETHFKITGVATYEVALPPTNVAKVLLPQARVTIIAAASCYPDIEHLVQIGPDSDGIEINFSFSNADRRPGCEEDAETPAHGPVAASTSPPSATKLAWVITNAAYANDWPSLDFVKNDRIRMLALLRGARYRVIVSSDSSRKELSAAEARFVGELKQGGLESVIVYVSGHGVALGDQNYLVPTDAPASKSASRKDLFPFSQITGDLQALSQTGAFVILLVDACRKGMPTATRTLLADDESGVLVNHSAGPDGISYDGDGMSAWTERFVAIADEFPMLALDQIVLYANRYTQWQSEASNQIQVPILYGQRPEHVPAFGTVQYATKGPIVPAWPLTAR